ncbi:hypothetical protein AABB24_020375 [Solanum stoloniferum]|uniref:Squalene cyclase C-terminal domain-containing protein n=1 Tax=Solanum stoloniferum TaxID=62892 RepID=A0ABD2T974_9SOLN
MLSALAHQSKHLFCLKSYILDTEPQRLTIDNAVKYFEDVQKLDGSWYGCWGVCFTYASWFALGGLAVAGKSYNNSAAVRKGVEFLLRTQRSDGGWGESYHSCPDKVYRELETDHSNLVQTSWALMGLIHSGQVNSFFFSISKCCNLFHKFSYLDRLIEIQVPSTMRQGC